jgi:hypothetical protein
MMQRVHAPEKRSCCPSRQKESGMFAPRGFAHRTEDNELDAVPQARPLSGLNFADVSLFPPVQPKLAGDRATGGHEHAEAASSQRRWGLSALRSDAEQAKPEPNRTGIPDRLKAGIESLSGIDMSDVRVHANSPKPAGLNALAYTQGNQIYLGPGQERHLPHEAWHAVQQKQGRVRATGQMKGGVLINDEEGLEGEAILMGDSALHGDSTTIARDGGSGPSGSINTEKGANPLSSDLFSPSFPSPKEDAEIRKNGKITQRYMGIDNIKYKPSVFSKFLDDLVNYIIEHYPGIEIHKTNKDTLTKQNLDIFHLYVYKLVNIFLDYLKGQKTVDSTDFTTKDIQRTHKGFNVCTGRKLQEDNVETGYISDLGEREDSLKKRLRDEKGSSEARESTNFFAYSVKLHYLDKTTNKRGAVIYLSPTTNSGYHQFSNGPKKKKKKGEANPNQEIEEKLIGLHTEMGTGSYTAQSHAHSETAMCVLENVENIVSDLKGKAKSATPNNIDVLKISVVAFSYPNTMCFSDCRPALEKLFVDMEKRIKNSGDAKFEINSRFNMTVFVGAGRLFNITGTQEGIAAATEAAQDCDELKYLVEQHKTTELLLLEHVPPGDMEGKNVKIKYFGKEKPPKPEDMDVDK